MLTFASLIFFISVVLAFLGPILRSLETFIEESDRSRIRQRITDFWFRIADLSGPERISCALVSRYRSMRPLRRRFLAAYWTLLAIMFFYNVVELYPTKPAAVASVFRATLKLDLMVRQPFILPTVTKDGDQFFEVRDNDCVPNEDPSSWQNEAKIVIGSGSEYERLISALQSSNPNRLWLLLLAANGATIFFLGIPLTLSLLVSFRVTLWLLSRFTRSAMWLTFIVIVDLLAAVVIPQFLASVLYLCTAAVMVFMGGGVIDFVSLGNPTQGKLVLGVAAVTIDASWAPFIIPSLFFYWIDDWTFRALMSWPSLDAVLISTYQRSIGFFGDAWRVFSGDFSPTNIDATRNWAVGIDLAYSLTYLIPCIAVVFLDRFPFARHVFLNMVQRIAEHPQGPIAALGDACIWLAKEMRRFLAKP